MRALLERLFRLLGWPDMATATMAATLYLFMSVSFLALGVLTARDMAATLGQGRRALFFGLLVAHTALHWFGLRLTSRELKIRHSRVIYCVVQAGLAVAICVLVPDRRLAMGLWVTLVAETAALLWPEWRAIVVSAAFYVGVLSLSAILIWGFTDLVQSLPTVGLLFGGILLYALLLVREGWTRQNAQALVTQLEVAQARLKEYAAQVERLSVSQERERMAREMHDTLAQGLAGVILQLEAADANLESDRPAEGRALVQQATLRARQTLHEARRAIQALRSAALEEQDLVAALASEVSQFEATWGVSSSFVVEGKHDGVPPEVAQNVLRVLQESLSNVGRHAQARHVVVRLAQSGSEMHLVVQDDGLGFDTQAVLQRKERYGLQGMYERAERIGATLRVESIPQGGTKLVLAWETRPEAEPEPGESPVGGVASHQTAQKERPQ